MLRVFLSVEPAVEVLVWFSFKKDSLALELHSQPLSPAAVSPVQLPRVAPAFGLRLQRQAQRGQPRAASPRLRGQGPLPCAEQAHFLSAF